MRVFLLILTLFLLYGCKSENVTPKYITDSKQYSTLGIDYHDIDEVTSKSSAALLESKFAQNIKEPQILAISNMSNESGEDIDIESITRDLTRKVSKSEKFILTNAITGSGSSVDSMIMDSRGLRNDKDFNQKSTQEKGNLLAPQYSLSGKIRGDVKNVGENIRVDYLFLFILTDLTSGKVVWDKAEVISKVVSKAVAKDYGLNNSGANAVESKGAKKDSKAPKAAPKKLNWDEAQKEVAKLTQECNDGNMESCVNLGGFYAIDIKNYGKKSDDKKAFELFQKACNAGNIDGCAALGAIYLGFLELENHQVAKDYKKGFDLLNNACNKNNALGCTLLGTSYYGGMGTKQSFANALESYEKACSLGDADGCYYLGNLYFDDTFSGLPPRITDTHIDKDNSKAYIFINRACVLKHAVACNVMGVAYHHGMSMQSHPYKTFISKNPTMANQYFEESCDLGYSHGCGNLANNYKNGVGTKKDTAKATEYYKKACDLGAEQYCDKK